MLNTNLIINCFYSSLIAILLFFPGHIQVDISQKKMSSWLKPFEIWTAIASGAQQTNKNGILVFKIQSGCPLSLSIFSASLDWALLSFGL